MVSSESHDPLLSSATDGGDTGPNELIPQIMTEIFHLTFDKPCTITWSHPLGPWLLESVCARWRKLVVSCSSLWASFASFENLGGPYDVAWRCQVRMTMRALRLSTTYPLTFIAGIGSGGALKAHAFRWRDATLFESIGWYFNRGSTENFPILERLHLVNTTRYSELLHLRLFANAPQLKTLILSGNMNDAGFPTTTQGFQAVTHPFMWVFLDLLYILKSCPNLLSFRDLSREDGWSGKEDWPLLCHRGLRVLHSNNHGFLHRIRYALSRFAPLFPARSLTFILDNRSTSRPFIETNMKHCFTRLSLDARCASFQDILVVCKHIAAHSTIFPSMTHLVLRLSHQGSVCSEDSLCLLSSPADASALSALMYELRIRDSPIRLNLVTLEVACPMKKRPDCVKDFMTQFRELKPSSVDVEFFMLSQNTVRDAS
ncbi:hypothetical protein CPB85DRAFT_1293621 [Mucidula mucida]|nr:hypothetical protein CPB85DRAFT_1293621 [Mucidula mucida]